MDKRIIIASSLVLIVIFGIFVAVKFKPSNSIITDKTVKKDGFISILPEIANIFQIVKLKK